jgi:hypothetical protein
MPVSAADDVKTVLGNLGNLQSLQNQNLGNLANLGNPIRSSIQRKGKLWLAGPVT